MKSLSPLTISARLSAMRRVVTEAATNLAERHSRNVSKTSALDFGNPQAPVQAVIVEPNQIKTNTSANGLGLTL
jgi:hypothetical protein